MIRKIIDRYWKRHTHRKRSRRYRRDKFHAEIARHLHLEPLEDRRLLAFDLSISTATTVLVGVEGNAAIHTLRTFTAESESGAMVQASVPCSSPFLNIACSLANFTTVKVDTGSPGTQPGNITVADSINVTLTAPKTLELHADNDLTFNSSADISASGNALHVLLNADRENNGSGNIDLNSGTVITSNGGNVTLSATGFNAASGTGVASGTGTITVSSDDAAIDPAASLTAAGNVFIKPKTATRPVRVGTEQSGELSLTDAELDSITAGTIEIGSANSGAITFSADITRPATTNINLQSPVGITVSGGFDLNSAGGTVSPVNNSTLTVNGSVTGPVLVPAGSTLLGTGTINGNVSGSGNFSPGNSPGVMIINGDFTPTGTVNFEVNSDWDDPGVSTLR